MGRRLVLFAAAFVIAVIVVFALYTWVTLHWSYSEGERAGMLQKFSKRGWVFKTWEGELQMTTVPGAAPVLWTFSVREDAAAEKLHEAIGRRVVLHYTEHRGVPTSWFGETAYFVDDVRIQE